MRKTKKIEEWGAEMDAVQFTKSVKISTSYVQINYNSEVADAIWETKEQIFTLPKKLMIKTF